MEKHREVPAPDTDLEGVDGCKQCYMESDDSLDSCPVVLAVRRKCNTSTGSPGVYSDMAMRILSRATVRPIQAIDVMDELFTDTDRISQSSMTSRFTSGLRGIKAVLGGGIVYEDPASDVHTYEIDPVAVEIWCRTHPIQSNRLSDMQPNVADPEEVARLEKYKDVTDLPDVTKLVLNYLKDVDQDAEMTEKELFTTVHEKLELIIAETGRSELVISMVQKARSMVLSSVRERQVYKKNPHGSIRFSMLESVLRPYQPIEADPDDE